MVGLQNELLNEVVELIASRTTRNGFYNFQRLHWGLYLLKVKVAGTISEQKPIRIDLRAVNPIDGLKIEQLDVCLDTDRSRNGQEPDETCGLFAARVWQNANTRHEAEITKKSFRSFLTLTIAQYKRNKKEATVLTYKKASARGLNSNDAHLFLEIVQQKAKRLNKVEKCLLKANELNEKRKQVSINNWHKFGIFLQNGANKVADEYYYFFNDFKKRIERKMLTKY